LFAAAAAGRHRCQEHYMQRPAKRGPVSAFSSLYTRSRSINDVTAVGELPFLPAAGIAYKGK